MSLCTAPTKVFEKSGSSAALIKLIADTFDWGHPLLFHPPLITFPAFQHPIGELCQSLISQADICLRQHIILYLLDLCLAQLAITEQMSRSLKVSGIWHLNLLTLGKAHSSYLHLEQAIAKPVPLAEKQMLDRSIVRRRLKRLRLRREGGRQGRSWAATASCRRLHRVAKGSNG